MSIEFKESVEAEAIGSDNDKPAGSGHALAIIVPTATAGRPWNPRCFLLKLIADAGDNASLRFLDDHHFLMTNENHRDVSRL
jgi:hypothetical protein